MVSLPVFQRFDLSNGNVLIVKMIPMREITKENLPRLEEGAARFRAKRVSYSLLNGGEKRMVAGLIRDFRAEEFHHSEVLQWGSFVEVNLSERDVSSALGALQKEVGAPVELITAKGAGSTWKVNRDAIEAYLA